MTVSVNYLAITHSIIRGVQKLDCDGRHIFFGDRLRTIMTANFLHKKS